VLEKLRSRLLKRSVCGLYGLDLENK